MLAFGVDLITFFHPEFWGLETEEQVMALGSEEPRRFWDRMLDTLAESGVTGVELTFGPFGPDGLVAAYGSVQNALEEVAKRGLVIASGFFADPAIEGNIGDPEAEARWIEKAGQLAAFLAEAGAKTLVMGLPMRSSWDAEPPRFVDLELARKAADFSNRLGAVTLRHDVRLALHTEAHSIFCQPSDIDLIMMLTDPIYVGFCPDSAHILLSGGDPVAVTSRHAERVITAHWKDATGPMPMRIAIDGSIHHAHREYFCAIGDGQVDFNAFAELMCSPALTGKPDPYWAILEIDAVPDPLSETRKSLAFARTVLARLCADTPA